VGWPGWLRSVFGAPGPAAPAPSPGVPPAAATDPSIEALYAAARIVGGGGDLAVTAAQTLEAIQATTRMDAGTLFRLDRATDTLHLMAHHGIRPEHVDALRVRPVAESHLREAIESGRSVVVPLHRSERGGERLRAVIEEAGYRTLLALPIPVSGQTWGILSMVSREERTFGADVLRLLEAVAHQVGLAVARATLFADEQARRSHLAALLEINTKIGALAPTDALLASIAEEAARLLGVDNAGFRLLDGDELVLAGVAGSAGETMLTTRIKIGESFSGKIVATGQALRGEVRSFEGIVPAHVAAEHRLGYTHILGVPLRVGARTIGALAFRARQPFTAQDQELAEAFAGQAAIAIEHARLFREATRQAGRMQALADLGRVLAETLDPEVVARRVVDSIVHLLEAQTSLLLTLDEATGDLTAMAVAGDAGAAEGEPIVFPAGTGLPGLALRERAIVTSTDLLADPRLVLTPAIRARVARAGFRAGLAVPLVVRDRVIGALVVGARSDRVFDAEDLSLARAFATAAAVAMDNARLYVEATRRGQEAGELAALARSLTESLRVEEVSDRIVAALISLFHVRSANIRLLAPDGGLVVVARGGPTEAVSARGSAMPTGYGISGKVVGGGRAFWTSDILAEPEVRLPERVREATAASGDLAYLAVPMRAKGVIIGTVLLNDRAGRVFTEAEAALLQTFADQSALALENARLYEETERRRREAEVIAEVARALNEALDVTTILQRVTEAARDLCGADLALIALRDPGGEDMILRHASGARARKVDVRLVAPGKGAGGIVITTGRPFRTDDYLADPRISKEYADSIRAEGIVAELIVPMLIAGRVEGLLYVDNRAPRPFTDRDEAVLTRLADHAGVAVANARLYAETERRRREAEVLAEIAGSLNASLDLATVLARVTVGARSVCGSDVARLLLREPDSDAVVTRACSGQRSAAIETLRIEPGKGVGGLVLASGKPFRTGSYADDPRVVKAYQSVVDAEGLVATMAVPIVIDGRVEGIVHVDNRSRRAFTDQDEAVLTRLADHAAVAIRNARLYRETAEFAERLRALDEVNRLVSSSLNPDEVLRNITAAAARFFDAPFVTMWVLDEARQRLLRSFTIGNEDLAAQIPRELGLGEGTVGWVALHREPLFWATNTDARVVPGVGVRFDAHGLRYRLVYPITIGDRVLGVLTANRASAVDVTPETESLLRSLAAQAAFALDHARLFAATAQRLEETRALLDVAEILNATLDSKQLLKRVTIRIAQVCRVDRCSIQRWDGTRMVPMMSQFADGQARPDMWRRFSTQAPWAGGHVPAQARAMETRRPVVVNDAASTDLIPPEWVEWFGMRAWMTVPLVRQDQVIGALNLDYCERDGRFEDWQVDLAMTIAGQLALSLENIRLYAEVQERLRETETLLTVAEKLSQPGTPEDVMRHVAREVGRATSCDMVGAYFLNEKRDALVALAGYHVPEALLPLFRARTMAVAGFPFVADGLSMGRTMWSADALHDPRFDTSWTHGVPPHAVLFVPTMAQGQPLGGLFLVWWQARRPFPAAEIPLVEGVATQVGLALENAELSRQTRAKLRETEALLSVSRALSTTLDLDAMLRHFMREAARTLGADTMAFWMAAEDGEWLEPFMGYHVPPDKLDEFRRLRVSMVRHAFYADAVRRRRPAFSAVGEGDPRLPADMQALRHKSQLFIPIVAREKVIGALAAVWWESSRELSASELTLLEALASQAGVAVENARLFTENRRQVMELSVLYDLSRAVTGQLERRALVDAILAHLERVIDVRNLVVLIRDEDANDVEVALRMLHGVRNETPPHRYPLHGIGLMAYVLEGRPLRTSEYVAECERRGVAPVDYGLEFPYWLGVPMKAGDSVLGAIAVRAKERPYTEADERLLANVADLAALALRSARLYEERARAFGELSAAQDQLVRTEKLRALGEMASGVAHDFNNLLASILGRAQLLLQRIEEPRQRKWLQVIERSALDGAQTVRRLQEFTRIRRDQPFVSVDVNQVVRDALEITQSRWREEPMSRGIAIDVRTELSEVPPIAGDPVELREALTNLVLNAVDAMPDGGVLTLRTARAEGLVELTIGDSGVGMPESVRQRMFDPFFTTKGAQGTGLGLSITYGILMRHRARVAVETEPGQGTTFRLAFEPGAAAVVVESAAPVHAPSGTALRCLIVDDEEPVGTVLGDVLETSGHSVVVLTSGADAIERFRAEPFDVVFTDLAMPGLSGWQVARAVKATAPTIPVFLVTGFGVELSAEERRAHGVDLVLSKPLNIQSILDAVAFAAAGRADGA